MLVVNPTANVFGTHWDDTVGLFPSNFLEIKKLESLSMLPCGVDFMMTTDSGISIQIPASDRQSRQTRRRTQAITYK